ncbi:MAG TPA: TAT-variant-translocated molybdopterin oxidoreductase [Planctomycetota bacterium]|nr:TAT-variant-translocated molybdopterin oxidoreductase [Planctomycetota bacterium]
MDETRKTYDWDAIRGRLRSEHGRRFWRSLDELSDDPAFETALRQEFPREASVMDSMGRRKFLQLMGASLALAGVTGCGSRGHTPEKIVPYVQKPAALTPGMPLYYATALTFEGFARGVLVQSNMGRPTKIEGNPQHPASLGATDAFMQAEILSLYDPDRSQSVTYRGNASTWGSFLSVLRGDVERQRATRGTGLRFLTEPITSPTLAWQIGEVLRAFPEARWHQYSPCAGFEHQGAMQAFGEPVHTIYHFDRAQIVLSLAGDFLSSGPGAVRYSRDFNALRRVRAEKAEMNRLYCAESVPSLVGAMADHRLPLKPEQIESFAYEIARALGVQVQSSLPPSGVPESWSKALVSDLEQNRGASLVVCGEQLPPHIHAVVHAINAELEAPGKTLSYTRPVQAEPFDALESIKALSRDIGAGRVSTLIIIGGNPVFNAPADLDFGDLLARVNLRVRMGLYEDETSAHCHWHIPQTHELEAWSDARAFDGTTSIMQPLTLPLYAGRSPHELLAEMHGNSGRNSHEIVRHFWMTQRREGFEDFWKKSVHDGVVEKTAMETFTPRLKPLAAAPQRKEATGLSVVFRPDPTIHDGRYANNGWLQELPKPLTKLTWDNVALVSPATAERLGLENRDLVTIRSGERRVQMPIWIMAGQADDCIALQFGYGRTRAGRVANGAGHNAFPLRTSAAAWSSSDVEIRKTGEMYALAATQHHHSMEGREIIHTSTLEEFRHGLQEDAVREAAGGQKQEVSETQTVPAPVLHNVAAEEPPVEPTEPDAVSHPQTHRRTGHGEHAHPSLLKEYAYPGAAWGMVIDQTVCTGCSACVIACQAENNIPIVGKDQVARGREMHWLRIDHYFSGELSNPRSNFQPMLCVHCEKAPCEVVCPVNATVHSAEGLNEMVYNRCIGTRYCSNNCPYKVRRFNFLQYSSHEPAIELMRNPQVTVRDRGVMEKCTYCVQRITAARIEAKKQNRNVRDGEVITACQAACPADAIVFGDINDKGSRVAKLKGEPHNYGVLSELGTQPRTTYLARVRNPHKALTPSPTPTRGEGSKEERG